MQPVEPLLITVKEAARRLSVGRTLLYDLMGRGVLGYVKVGGTRRLRIGDLEKLIANNYVGPNAS
jgi:excisionase family DNA binding protein